MNGYSKISSGPAHKPRSIDFSDSISFPQTPKAGKGEGGNNEEEEEVKKNKTENCYSERAEKQGEGERFGVILGRSCSVSSSSSSSAFGFQATMKRAFSMRRSSSVSERYCRIHDQYMGIASPIGDHDVEETRGSMKMKMKNKCKGGGSKILKACKRLFGL